jgi:hypothetical protein
VKERGFLFIAVLFTLFTGQRTDVGLQQKEIYTQNNKNRKNV